jgi:Arc/MetJ-type ribon-helix-helix transcriptional regulator
MTRYEKIAVSLPSRAAESARRAVKQGRAPSVSAYIAAAIEEQEKRASLDELLDKWLEESGGPPNAAERRWADRVLGSKPKRSRPAKRRR